MGLCLTTTACCVDVCVNKAKEMTEIPRTFRSKYCTNQLALRTQSTQPTKETVCPICKNMIEEDSRIEGKCGHVFHLRCLERASQNFPYNYYYCPVCDLKFQVIQIIPKKMKIMLVQSVKIEENAAEPFGMKLYFDADQEPFLLGERKDIKYQKCSYCSKDLYMNKINVIFECKHFIHLDCLEYLLYQRRNFCPLCGMEIPVKVESFFSRIINFFKTDSN